MTPSFGAASRSLSLKLSISVDQSKLERIPGYRARRWVVERTHSWLNRFRRLLIRWEEKKKNYVAMTHFACAWLTWRATGLFGR
ncbi:MAG: transposase [Thaumarchaeota archaeon]|nr:transposase [Nitrososphaerota archaeon]